MGLNVGKKKCKKISRKSKEKSKQYELDAVGEWQCLGVFQTAYVSSKTDDWYLWRCDLTADVVHSDAKGVDGPGSKSKLGT